MYWMACRLWQCFRSQDGHSLDNSPNLLHRSILNLVTGKASEKKISPLMYVLTVLFILKYVLL